MKRIASIIVLAALPVSALCLTDLEVFNLDDFMRMCLETLESIEGASGRSEYHILYSILWSDKKDALVLMTFGTPARDWEKNRCIADVMADFELIGKDFGKTAPTNR